MNKACSSVLAGLVALLLPSFACSQTYPVKPVRVVVPFAPGGSNDIVGRIVFQQVAKSLGKQFVIENRPGAGGVMGAAFVASSAPDGYTILMHSAVLLSNAHLHKQPYDSLNDFIGVTPLGKQVFMLVVHPSLPVKSVAQFIALAKRNPDQILYGSGGFGTTPHLSMALLTSMSRARMAHVPYKGGGPAGVSLISGETQAMMANTGVLLQHIKSGRVRPLGVTSSQRMPLFPNIPTIGETVPEYEFIGWVGCFVPAGAPKAVIEKLNAVLREALSDRGVADQLSNQTFDPMYMASGEFTRLLKAEYEKYRALAKEIAASNK
ncbi:MAG: tripartite tricarboxylate transporter substrate binding protein [Betaproteobacteria bacterium]|nr:tripartite tricarboxylate transporter substrate binding protein [Betaproteobacteria bacterium]